MLLTSALDMLEWGKVIWDISCHLCTAPGTTAGSGKGVLAGRVTFSPAWDTIPGFREEWDKLALKEHVMGQQLGSHARSTGSSHVFLSLQQLKVGCGPWAEVSGFGKGCCVCSSIVCTRVLTSPAVLGQGEFLWGVTGGSRLRVMLAKSLVLLLAGDDLIFSGLKRDNAGESICNFPVCSNSLSAEGGGCLAPRVPGIWVLAQRQAGEHSIPGLPCPPCVTKQAERKVCRFCHVQEGARCCAEPQEPVLGCAGVQSCFSSQVCCRCGIGHWLSVFSFPFPMQGVLSPHLLGKALLQTELCFLQLCSAAGKGLGLRVL
ncbi:uncharacterized protein LOC120498099 isoform X2 [Passer montanus]|uniref:uncharacterized protein LOC120498099 isoform X1 n=1 Tax=Passer montanus TaxID=9160 RepID=UPI0019603AAD|nr:uncharacterized protein LOC120498099 isoform X1 [Passer montanus]XP_039556382.1 uncharacterized protein LOC120498099 isoform X2 [Passer montanus]